MLGSKQFFCVVILSLISLGLVSSFYIKNHFYSDNGGIYKKIKVDEEVEKKLPVSQLIENIRLNRLHLIRHSFKEANQYEKFLSFFKSNRKNPNFQEFIFEEQVSSNSNNHYSFKILNRDNSYASRIDFEVEYNKVVKGFVISDFSFQDELQSKSSSVKQEVLGYIDDVGSLNCATSESAGFNYIRLKTKDENGLTINPETLGSYAFEFPYKVSPSFYNTSAFKQIPFDVRTVEDFSYDPGYVVSIKDTEENELGKLFTSIVDADGTLEIQNSTGERIDYPVGFFIDKLSERIVAITNTNRVRFYDEIDALLGKPIAIKIIGNFLYILDSRNEKVVFYEVKTPDGEEINLSYRGFLDLGYDLGVTSDISGYEGQNNNFLFISSLKRGELIRVKLDKKSGLNISSGTAKFNSYLDPLGGNNQLPVRISRIEVIPNGSNENEARIIAVQNSNRLLSFALYNVEEQLSLVLEHENWFPATSNLSNLGYNLGDKSFYATDIQGKLHVLSKQGEYLGSGGEHGKGERNEEMFYPNIITSNFFRNDASELIVGNSWGNQTGFKRIIPSPDLGKIDVIEKATADPRMASFNELIVRYSLTSGLGVNEIKIELNDKEVLLKKDDFYAQTYSQSLRLNEVSLDGIINEGWNNVAVTLKANVLTEANTWREVEKVKEVSFFYSPSVISLEKAISKSSVLSPDENNEINIYKSLFIEGKGDLKLDDKEIILHQGVTVEFDDSISYNIRNSNFSFMCGAKLKIKGVEDVPKVFTGCMFNGLSENLNMVTVYGEHTGGNGKGSAPSSKVEFIDSEFHSYYGKAVHIAQGRATLVNCNFDSKDLLNNVTSTGILVSPGSRLDLIGNSFYNNDIAVESASAELYVNTKKGKYKGYVINDNIFQHNKIGIYNLGGYARIENSSFLNHLASIVCIEGVIDISKKAENVFSNNRSSVIVSGFLLGDRGLNQFINNENDITILHSSQSNLTYDLSCNLWIHNGISDGKPLFNVKYTETEASDKYNVVVEYNPYAELSEKGKLQCKGSNKPDSEGVSQEEILKNKGLLAGLELGKDLLNEQMSSPLVNEKYELVRGFAHYGSYKSKRFKYEEHLYKNTLAGILFNLKNSQENESYSSFASEFQNRSMSTTPSIAVTSDRVAFIAAVIDSTFDEEVNLNKASIHLSSYPNPSSGLFNLDIEISEEGFYSVYLISHDGKTRAKLTSEEFFVEGKNIKEVDISNYPPGLYILSVRGKNKSKASIRIVKI